MKKINLQRIGERNAIQANELKVDDIMICNFGYTQTIKNIEISNSGKSIKTIIECNGKLYNKSFRNDTLIAVQRVNA